MTTMSTWFKETPESLRLVAEETALLEASELVIECLEGRQVNKSTLANRLGVSRSEVTQRLNGKRNLTVRTLGAMLHELGYRLRFDVQDLAEHRTHRHVQVASGTGWTAPGARYTRTGTSLHLVRGKVAS